MLSERIRKYWEITSYDELADEAAKYEMVARAAKYLNFTIIKDIDPEKRIIGIGNDGTEGIFEGVKELRKALADLPEGALGEDDE